MQENKSSSINKLTLNFNINFRDMNNTVRVDSAEDSSRQVK